MLLLFCFKSSDNVLDMTAVTIFHQVAGEGQNYKVYIDVYNVHIALCLL